MKPLFLLAMALFCSGVTWAATDPGDRFLQAYFLVQEGDEANKAGDAAKADAKFASARYILQEIKEQSPNWNPHIIEFRLRYCHEQLAALKPKLPNAPTLITPAQPTVVTTVVVQAAVPVAAPAPAGPRPEDEERITKLTTDLAQAHQQIGGLETSRQDLNTRLAEALKQVPATETNVKIEEMLAQNKKLSEQLAGAQQRIEDLAELTDQLQQAQTRIKELETTRETLTTQLQESQTKVSELETNHPRVAELQQQNQDLATKLAQTQQELATARTGTATAAESAEIQKLRAQLAEAMAEMEQSQQELTTAYVDLGSVKKELEVVRGQNVELKRTYEGVVAKLGEAEGKIAALEMGGQKNDQIILFLRKENTLLKQIADRQPAGSRRRPLETASEGRRPVPARPAAKREPAPQPVVKESASSQLVAELSAAPPSPFKPEVAKTTAPERQTVPAPFVSASETTRTLLNEARTAFGAKDYATARTKYEAVLDAEPNNLLALSNVGVIYYQQGKLQDAESFLRRAVALAPNDAESRALMGVVYFRRGKTEEAFAELTRAIAINPRHAEAHNYLGITLSEKGWSASAEQEIRKAIELNPQYADAHFNLAVLYANLRTPRYELARYHYQKSLDLGAPPEAKLAELLKKADAK